MKINMSGLFNEPIVSWRCGCSADGPEIPITDTCPKCGKPMPQTERNWIYNQVKKELQDEIQYEKSYRQKKTKKILRRVIPIAVIGLIVLTIIGLCVWMPEVFRPVEDWAAGAWQWLCDAFVAGVEFLTPILGWLGSMLAALWSGVCWLAVFLWDLLLALLEDLPEILGWLWAVLMLLFNQLWLLVQFALEVIPAVFALAIGLIGTLLQVLVMLLGGLWEAIMGIFSLFF